MEDQSKPWDFEVSSESAIPEIYRSGERLCDNHHGVVDFKMHWHTNDERGPVDTKWQVLMASVHDPYHLTFISAIGNHANICKDVPIINQTCEEAERWVNGTDKAMRLNLDCEDVIKGLKAVQREARITTQVLKEVVKAMPNKEVKNDEARTSSYGVQRRDKCCLSSEQSI